MEPILDETSLVPCATWPPSARLAKLAETLQVLDSLGTPKILRSVRDAIDRDIGSGRGMRYWCFERSTNRDAGRLLASRLGKQPFIDGEGGLFAVAEGIRAVEASARGSIVFGLGLAALVGGIVVALGVDTATSGGTIHVNLTCVDDEGERAESVGVPCFVESGEVEAYRSTILELLDLEVTNGLELMERAAQMFPRLRFGARARAQVAVLTGAEPVFRQLLRHLHALDLGARDWTFDGPFVPRGITFSQESGTTLAHGTLGPMRDFPVPDGFVAERFSLHTKLTGGNGARLYFRPERVTDGNVVVIGYFGAHLSTVSFKT